MAKRELPEHERQVAAIIEERLKMLIRTDLTIKTIIEAAANVEQRRHDATEK